MAVIAQLAAALSLAALITCSFLASLPPAAQQCLWTVPANLWKHASSHASYSQPFSAVSFPAPAETQAGLRITAEHVLLSQLSQATTGNAGPLHVALAQVYRASGQGDKALKHYQAAVEVAARSGRNDRLVDALVALGEAYLRARRPKDAERELTEALRLIEHSHAQIGAHQELAVDRALGYAKRDLGQLNSALALFNRAVSRRGTKAAEDIAGLLSDIGEVHHFRGEDKESLKFLIQAQDRLRAASRGDGIRPMSIAPRHARDEMTPELYRRMAEVLRSLGRDQQAKSHYEEALRLERLTPKPRTIEIELIEAGLAKLQRISGDRQSKKQRKAGATWKRQGSLDEAKALLERGELRDAESAADLAVAARVQLAQGLHGNDVAVGMNLLGSIRRDRERYTEAAEAYLSALTAALATPRDGGGIEGVEAGNAYFGISYIMPMYQLLGQSSEAEALLARAVAIADAAGVSANSPERHRYEERLRANAVNPAFRMSSNKNTLKTSSRTADWGTDKHAAATLWWRGKSDAHPRTKDPVSKGLIQKHDLALGNAKSSVALRGQKMLENAKQLMADGKLDRAETVAEDEAMLRVRMDGGIQGKQVASAMNLLGSIRREREHYADAGEAYLSALTAALANAKDGGGIEGAEAKTAYLGISYIMPMYQLVGDAASAESLLTQAVTIADHAGVPKSSLERQRYERRLRANAVNPVYHMQETSLASIPLKTDADLAEKDAETTKWVAEELNSYFASPQDAISRQQTNMRPAPHSGSSDDQLFNTF